MRRATKCLVFMLIMTMLSVSLLAGVATALAADPATQNAGKIEAIVWDDGIKTNVATPMQEGVNGVTVVLYRVNADGSETQCGEPKVTGAGGGFQYGYVCWENLPVVWDFSTTTTYKLRIVTNDQVYSLNGSERIVELNVTNLWRRWFFEVTDPVNGLEAFKIHASPYLLGPVVNKGQIEVAVWDDAIIPDKSDSRMEGVDGLTVNIYGKDEKGNWKLCGSQVTGAGGFTAIALNGWSGWRELPVVDDGRVTTEYKLELVQDGTFEPLNGTERIVRLNQSNNFIRYFFDTDDGMELPAFRIKYKAFKTENLGMIETVVWDDNVLPKITDSKQEGVDGLTVNLYSKDADGEWQLYGTQTTTGGGFLWALTRGWVGWKNLPVVTDWRMTTEYKLELVTDRTFQPLTSVERIVKLNWTNSYYRWLFEVAEDSEMLAYPIKSTTVLISGAVWYDANADQVRQWAERKLGGWTVVLTNAYGTRIASTKTDANGYYQFRGLKPGTYKVWVGSQSYWKQVYPYYKFLTWPPYGCEKGHHTIYGKAGVYYMNKDFGMLSMRESIWATLYYGLWWIGLLAYQF